MRTQFAFYKSFDDVYNDLNNSQKLEFIDTLLNVQFLRLKVEDVAFKDNILKHIWNAQKHSIEKSINGYLESQKNSKIKNPYLGIYDPIKTPSEGIFKGIKTPYQQEKEKEKEEVKGEDKVKVSKKSKSFFNLEKPTSFDNLSSEYIEKLKEKIESNNENIMIERLKVNSPLTELYTFEDFSVRFLSNGMKKKDWWMTFIQYQGYVFENESKRKGIL